MIKNNRIVVDYSLSVLERNKASKLINEYKNEYIKPYDYIFMIKKGAVYIFAIAAVFNILLLILLSLDTSSDGNFFERIKVLSIILLSLFGLALGLLKIYDVVIDNVMRKHESIEQEDKEILQKVKLNRFFIENITSTVSGKTYWKNIKDSYKKDGFIFIHMLNDGCVVIPERIFSSESEAAEAYDFIRLQLAQNK